MTEQPLGITVLLGEQGADVEGAPLERLAAHRHDGELAIELDLSGRAVWIIHGRRDTGVTGTVGRQRLQGVAPQRVGYLAAIGGVVILPDLGGAELRVAHMRQRERAAAPHGGHVGSVVAGTRVIVRSLIVVVALLRTVVGHRVLDGQATVVAIGIGQRVGRKPIAHGHLVVLGLRLLVLIEVLLEQTRRTRLVVDVLDHLEIFIRRAERALKVATAQPADKGELDILQQLHVLRDVIGIRLVLSELVPIIAGVRLLAARLRIAERPRDVLEVLAVRAGFVLGFEADGRRQACLSHPRIAGLGHAKRTDQFINNVSRNNVPLPIRNQGKRSIGLEHVLFAAAAHLELQLDTAFKPIIPINRTTMRRIVVIQPNRRE